MTPPWLRQSLAIHLSTPGSPTTSRALQSRHNLGKIRSLLDRLPRPPLYPWRQTRTFTL